MAEDNVVEKTLEVLAETPLCDRCLGRLFARLGYGWDNKLRGRALKIAALMEAHRREREGVEGSQDLLRRVVLNVGPEVAGEMAKAVVGLEPREWPACTICGGGLDAFIVRAAEEAEALMKLYDIERFIVGVRVEDDTVDREEKIRVRHQLPYGESIKAEIRREVGKRLRDKGYKPDFDNPEATILVYYPSGRVDIQVNNLYLKGRYWKLARYISQAYWPSPQGPRYYSVEQAAWGLLRLTGAESLVVHAAGREDVDARMLGTGRPLVIELKAPRRRRIPVEELEKAANSSARGLVEFRLEGEANRKIVRLYKSELAKSRKTYKALIVFHEPVQPDVLGEIETFFRDRTILQRTPKRVLHRRPDILRRRRVYNVKCAWLVEGAVAECIVHAEGGLYVKELVSGDDGRTTPSFSDVAGVEAECVELDVIAVEIEPRQATTT